MLSRLSRSRRPGLCAQLIRHFSIRVPPLKKQSLVVQLLRGKASPKLTNPPQKAEQFFDAAHHKCAKAIPLLQQGEASLGSLHPHPPLGQLAGAGNASQEDDDAGSAHIAKPSVRSKKGIQRSDVATKLYAVSQPRGGCNAEPCEGKTKLNGLSKLSVPSRVSSVDALQSRVEAQATSKRGQASDCDGKPFQRGEKKLYPSEVSVQPRVAGEDGHHSHIPPSGNSLGLQIGGASKKICHPSNKLDNSPLSAGSSKETVVTEGGDEPGKCIRRKLSTSHDSEEGEVQNAVEHNLFQLKTAVEREINKRLELGKLVELYSEMIRRELTDTFLNDWQQMSTEIDSFFNNLQLKIDLVNTESVALVHVKALLVNREFLSASPKKLAEVLTILKQFFESHDKTCEILAKNPKLIVQRPDRLQDNLKVLVEFEVDKATCYKSATVVMSLGTKKLKRNLSVLKDLGLSAESRNKIICRAPRIMRCSIKNHMESTENFFKSIEIARSSVLKLVELCPVLILTSVNTALRVVYKLFQHVGLSSTAYVEALAQMRWVRSDVFLHYNFFSKQGLSDEAFASMITRNPYILCSTIESVEAKLHFLLHKVMWDISEAIVFPRYFNYSLANRIIPRFQLLEELNLPRKPALSTVVASSNLRLLAVQ